MTLDDAIKHAEEVAETSQRVVDTGIVFDDVTIDMLYCDDTEVIEEHLVNYQRCADEHRQLAEWLKQLKEIKRILDAPSYEENGVTYSYCYDSDTKLKHIREVIYND